MCSQQFGYNVTGIYCSGTYYTVLYRANTNEPGPVILIFMNTALDSFSDLLNDPCKTVYSKILYIIVLYVTNTGLLPVHGVCAKRTYLAVIRLVL